MRNAEPVRPKTAKRTTDLKAKMRKFQAEVKEVRSKTGYPRRACKNIVARRNGFFNWDVLVMACTDRKHDECPARGPTNGN